MLISTLFELFAVVFEPLCGEMLHAPAPLQNCLAVKAVPYLAFASGVSGGVATNVFAFVCCAIWTWAEEDMASANAVGNRTCQGLRR